MNIRIYWNITYIIVILCAAGSTSTSNSSSGNTSRASESPSKAMVPVAPTPSPPIPSHVDFPLEGYDFMLACNQCFKKYGEGVKGGSLCLHVSLFGGYLGLKLYINSLTILFIIFNPSCKRSNLFLFSFGNICLNIISPLPVYTSEGPIGLLDSGSNDNLKIIKVRCIKRGVSISSNYTNTDFNLKLIINGNKHERNYDN